MLRDTRPLQQERHAEILRAMIPAQRAQALRAVDRGVRRMALTRLRQRHRHETEQQLVIRLVAQIHGAEVARRVYRNVPDHLNP